MVILASPEYLVLVCMHNMQQLVNHLKKRISIHAALQGIRGNGTFLFNLRGIIHDAVKQIDRIVKYGNIIAWFKIIIYPRMLLN